MKKTFLILTILIALYITFGFAHQSVFAADTITASVYLNQNSDFYVDTIQLTMDENVTTCDYDPADWTIDVPGTINISQIYNVSCTSNVIAVEIYTDTGVTGGAIDPVISYTNAGIPNSIVLTSAPMTTKSSITITDAANPTLSRMGYLDANANGKIDTIRAYPSEEISASSVLSANDLIFDNDGDFNGVAFGSNTTDLITSTVLAGDYITIPLGTESTAIDTDDNFNLVSVSSQNAYTLIDALLINQSTSFTGQSARIDTAVPVIKSFTYEDIDTDGKVDHIRVSFSEFVRNISSVLRANDLAFTHVGDFTGAAFGTNATDLLTGMIPRDFILVPLGTEASVIDTHEDSGNLVITTQNTFTLVDFDSNINTTRTAQSQAIIIDDTAPVITSVTPINAATDVSTAISPIITFSESMDTSTLTFDTSPAIVHTQIWSNNDITVTLPHATSISYPDNTLITAIVSTAKDNDNNDLASLPYSWSFTTGITPVLSSGPSNSSSRRSTARVIPKLTITPPIISSSHNTLLTSLHGLMGLFKKGMRSSQIMVIQETLNQVMSTEITTPLGVDGIFGSKTEGVVKLFQSTNGLVQDGIVGPKTIETMKAVLE